MNELYPVNLFLQQDQELFREHNHTVFAPLTVEHGDLMHGKIDILDPELTAFRDPEPAAVEHAYHEPGGTFQEAQDLGHFFPGHDNRDAQWSFSPHGINGLIELNIENIAIQKNNGIEGLVLGGGADLSVHGQMREKSFDLCRSHSAGMPHVMKDNILFDPGEIGLFGSDGIMFAAQYIPDLIRQLDPLRHHSLLDRQIRSIT
jgi:hypothetical protein